MSKDIPSSEITPKSLFLSRRSWLAAAGLSVLSAPWQGIRMAQAAPISQFKPSAFSTSEEKTPHETVTSYNNFYEFGTGKTDPAETATGFKTTPWSVKIDGLCDKPATFSLEDLIDPKSLEERVYRMRCVEGWSMVIPWIGVPLSAILAKAAPQSAAKYVAFETLNDPAQMPGLSDPVLQWPYKEGLRLDEAMHPLTIMAVGLYGEELLPQNGAPLRLVVPWKYGFKSIKSVVRITLTDRQPPTSWNEYGASEYGFYSNVNPQVDHPRWSQAKERRLGEFLRRDTLMFNGYGDDVASLYTGMDLKANF